MQEPTIFTLDNGLRVIYTHYPHVSSMSVHLLGKAGMTFEPSVKGTAHCLEHVVFNGTEKYSTAQELDRLIEDVGGDSNGATGREYVKYYATVLARDTERALEYLSQIVLHPLLREKDLIKEQQIIIQEAKAHLSDPYSVAWDKLQNLTYEESQMTKPITGLPEDVASITHREIELFKNTTYVAENFVLSLCGPLPLEEIKEKVESYFGSFKSGAERQTFSPTYKEGFAVHTEEWATAQHAHVIIGYRAPSSTDERAFATVILNSILGGSKLSRLFQTVREEHNLSYYVGSSYSMLSNTGGLYIYAGLEEENIPLFVELVKKELLNISTKLVHEEEFSRTQQSIIAEFLFKSDATSSTASTYASNLLFDPEYLTFQSYVDRFARVTKEEVLEEAENIFNSLPKVSVVSSKKVDEDTFSTLNAPQKTQVNQQ